METVSKRGDHLALRWIFLCSLFLSATSLSLQAVAGPYPPAAGKPHSTAIHKDDPAFVAWATGWENYVPGEDVDATFRTPEKAVGKTASTSFDIVSLGRDGQISMTFEPPIQNGEGWDFAVFENSFDDTFLELAYVEVSSDGTNFIRFDNDSLTPYPVGGFGSVDPTNINGFAGKYRQGYGTPFDLHDLAVKKEVQSGLVNLARIEYVKIIDIVGDGTYLDTSRDVIYDPYPTIGSAGFDLDAIGVRYQNPSPEGSNNPPDQPTLSLPADTASDVPLAPTLRTESFSDPDPGDVHLLTRWQISNAADFSQLVLDVSSHSFLTSLAVPASLLSEEATYYWRVTFYDGEAAESDWSKPFWFKTTVTSNDSNADGIPDNQALEPGSIVDLNEDNTFDVLQIGDEFKSLKTFDEGGQMAVSIKDSKNISQIASIESIDPSAISNTTNRPDNMPLGLLSFNLKVDNSGGPYTVTVYLSQAMPPAAKWYKYDPMNGWQDYSAHATPSANRRSVTLQLQDGGPGDADGVKNGVMVDPGGVGYSSSPSPPSGSEAGFGGGGGCFIATAAYGSPLEASVEILRNFRDVYLMPYGIGRAFIKTYYRYSRPMADFIAKHDTLRTAFRIGLLPLIAFSYTAINFGVITGAIVFVLILVLPIIVVLFCRWGVRGHSVNTCSLVPHGAPVQGDSDL
ncbi:MAG: hypothetical protein KAV83_07955 [Desulfobacterales bacterium]|nr:hypothetical protein [Desulfobacterales bacterium]